MKFKDFKEHVLRKAGSSKPPEIGKWYGNGTQMMVCVTRVTKRGYYGHGFTFNNRFIEDDSSDGEYWGALSIITNYTKYI